MAPHKTLYTFLFAILCVASVAGSCTELSKEDSQKINKALRDSLTSTTETWDVDMEIMEEGFKKVRLTGSYAATFNTKETKETRIKGPVHIDVFDSTGAITTTVDCNRTIYNAENFVFEFFGNVRVNTKDNRHLESEYLKWKQGSDKISTPEFVIITTPSDSIAGSGFEGSTDLTNYTIKEPKGRVIVN
ncbi:MAG: LPS export ABC transporter periplasmic protein LptC [Balneolaceae bacterium]|nr:LPS export ABC transporter periplasmic protein LptC [Balneolaceae bacterium]